MGSKRHEKPPTRHSRGGGNPEAFEFERLDSRLRGNDESSASQDFLTKCALAIRIVSSLDHGIAC
jgi:hypothetical protein